VAVLFVAPVFLWEICLAVHLVTKGFRTTTPTTTTPPAVPDLASVMTGR
jgi:hypothetical protein